MIYTTLNKIRAAGPCGLKPDSDGTRTGLCKLMHHLGKTTTDDEPVSFAVILESNGLDDALWCLRTMPEESKRWRKLAVSFARTVQHLMTDPRSLRALDVAQAHAEGRATDSELDAAWDAAGDDAEDARAAGAAAGDAWAAAWAAGDAAGYDAGPRMSAIFLACLDAP